MREIREAYLRLWVSATTGSQPESGGCAGALLLREPLRQSGEKLGHELAGWVIGKPATGIELFVSAGDEHLRLLHDGRVGQHECLPQL